MPKLIALYIRSVAIGFGLSAVFLGLMLWFDVAGLRQFHHFGARRAVGLHP